MLPSVEFDGAPSSDDVGDEVGCLASLAGGRAGIPTTPIGGRAGKFANGFALSGGGNGADVDLAATVFCDRPECDSVDTESFGDKSIDSLDSACVTTTAFFGSPGDCNDF